MTSPTSTIVCATELHAASGAMVDVAARLAEVTESTLTLVHVADRGRFEIPKEVPAAMRESLEALRTRVEDQAKAAIENLDAEKARCEKAGVQTQALLEEGRPWEAVVRVSKSLKPLLTIVGRHGQDAGSRQSALVLGSTAERIVRKSSHPVLVWSANTPPAGSTAHMAGPWVIGVDFSPASIAAATFADQLAKQLGAQLHLVHAVETSDLVEEEIALYGTVGWHPTLLEWCENRSKQQLERLRGQLTSVKDIHVFREGSATDGLLESAEQLKASLVVVGAHGRRGISEFLLGTTAERVLRRYSGSVLCVPQAAHTT